MRPLSALHGRLCSPMNPTEETHTMLVTRQPVLRRFWYALFPISAIAEGPKPFTLLGEHLVVWKTADGSPAALRDRKSVV